MMFVTIGNLSMGIFLLEYLFMENFPLRVCSWDLENFPFPFNFDFFFFLFRATSTRSHAPSMYQHTLYAGVTPDGMRWKIMLYFVIMITKIKLYITYLMNKNFLFYFLCSTLYSTNHNLSCIIFTFLIK